MNKALLICSVLICLIFSATSAFSVDNTRLRDQADSEFRIAEKAYKNAINSYGETLTGMPEEEKASACKKVSTALYDNRTQYNLEDLFTQMKYRKQIQKLENFASGLGCGN